MTDGIELMTLRWVNEQREKRGMPTLAEMPQGYTNNPWQCPVAYGLSGITSKPTIVERILNLKPSQKTVYGWANRTQYAASDTFLDTNAPSKRKRHNLPVAVQIFIERFDRKEYPHLRVPKDYCGELLGGFTL